jgi:predicted porin
MIDEHFLVMRGSFGQFEVGAMDSAAIKTTVGYMGSWATQVGENSAFGPGDWISGVAGGVNFGGHDGTLRNMQLRMFDDDSNKISYYTPRFEGFQLGVSYTPNSQQNTFAGSGGSPAPSGAVAGSPGAVIGNGTELGVPHKNVYHEGWSIGANFDRKFGDLGVGVAAGYVTAKSPGTNSVETAAAWKNTDDAQTWGIGAAIEWGPFKVSGGYRENKDVRDGFSSQTGTGSGTSIATSLDGTLYDVGGRFTFGPNAVSVSYRSGNVEGIKTDPADVEEEAFMVSFRRTLGPGVNWDANIFHLKTTGEPTATAAAAPAGTNPNEVSGWAFTTAIQLAF